jgi:hypothetical protein
MGIQPPDPSLLYYNAKKEEEEDVHSIYGGSKYDCGEEEE